MQNSSLPEIRKTIVISAPIEKVWKAVSTSDGMAAWWMANTFEPLVGQKFVLKAGSYGDSQCQVTELEPMNRLGFDWDSDWHLTFELKNLGDNQTEFTLIHAGFDAEKSTAFGQPHTVVRDIMNGGWEKIVNEKLPSFLASL